MRLGVTGRPTAAGLPPRASQGRDRLDALDPYRSQTRLVEVVNGETDETFVVRGEDLYTVVLELAQQCGIELEDG